MLRYLWSDELPLFAKLQDQMFCDRAAVFRDRLGWPVHVDAQGWERDEYDRCNPLYVIWQCPDGGHGGSMRFLPTLGRTMINDHFAHLTGRRIESPKVWECTRFCLSDRAGAQVSAALMLGGAELGLGFGLTHTVGVFDARMARVYRRLGWSPDIIGAADDIRAGLWRHGEDLRPRLAARAGLSPEISRLWFSRAFGLRLPLAAAG